MMIRGKQCTIVWYVDDKQLSHKDPKLVTKILEIMKTTFRRIGDTHGICRKEIQFYRNENHDHSR